MNKPQATMKDVPKKPFGKTIGRGATKATFGAGMGLARFIGRNSKNFVEGVVEAGREIKNAYDEGVTEADEHEDASV